MVNKKRASLEALNVNGAGGAYLLQPLANVIAEELEHIQIEKMLCYA